MNRVQVVLANNDRVTLRVGDAFLKIDADQTRTDVEVEALAIAPVPTPEILWRKPPVLAVAALPGRALGRLGVTTTASPAAWAAAGAAIRTLHEAPLPPWPGPSVDRLASRLADECDWLVASNVLPPNVVTRNRHLAEKALRRWTPVFIHGDLHIEHVFVDGERVTGIIDWSEARQGGSLFDLATLTLGHGEHLGDVIAGYGIDVDHDLIRAWRSWRCLTAIRWLFENGYGVPEQYPEVAVLRSQSQLRSVTKLTVKTASCVSRFRDLVTWSPLDGAWLEVEGRPGSPGNPATRPGSMDVFPAAGEWHERSSRWT